MLKIIRNKLFYTGLFIFLIFALAFFVFPRYWPTVLTFSQNNLTGVVPVITVPEIPDIVKKVVKHQVTPPAVKGIYMTACVAGTPSFRTRLLQLATETEINSLIIDVKDYTGTISFNTTNPLFKDNAGGGCRSEDLADFVETLHNNNIYVIARITAFQDPYLAKTKPEWAVKKNSDKNINWKDRKGISYIDAGNKEMWQYLAALGQEAYALGFDEINFDYIRFPSDGDMSDIYFPWSTKLWAEEKNLTASTTMTISTSTLPVIRTSPKSRVLKSFFEYLHQNFSAVGIPISADLFGMTTTNYDDLNIGQILEDAAPNFDFIAPMVYPSHYPVGFMGYKSVAEVNASGYNIVNYSMKIAADRLVAIGESPLKLRPWLQDNDYPVHYTSAMVREQIQATYDAGLTSWMLWDAGNTYTKEALDK